MMGQIPTIFSINLTVYKHTCDNVYKVYDNSLQWQWYAIFIAPKQGKDAH